MNLSGYLYDRMQSTEYPAILCKNHSSVRIISSIAPGAGNIWLTNECLSRNLFLYIIIFTGKSLEIEKITKKCFIKYPQMHNNITVIRLVDNKVDTDKVVDTLYHQQMQKLSHLQDAQIIHIDITTAVSSNDIYLITHNKWKASN